MSHFDHFEEQPLSGTLHTRRQFLRTSMLGAAAAWTVPVFLERTFAAMDEQAADSLIQGVDGRDGRILVIVQLAGGNDGLNTVIPYADDAYYRRRPRIGIAAEETLKINDYLGLHPELVGLRGLYDEGNLAILNGVGYPNPNRSHFRSMEIWQTAVDSDKFSTTGWLGRYFDSHCEGADPLVGVSIGEQMPQAFSAKTPTGVTFSRPEQYRWVQTDNATQTESAFRDLNRPNEMEMTEEIDVSEASGGSILSVDGKINSQLGTMDFLKRTALDAQLSSDRVLEIARKVKTATKYPGSRIGNSLGLVGKMIAGKLPTRVYYVSQGGYDTHAGQLGSHGRLMRELNAALMAFQQDMKEQGNFERVMVVTFSEFGRRVAENGNAGTDHGAAAPMFIMGGNVKPGILGKYPSLTDLHQGDLKYQMDFRSVYATLLDRWLGVSSDQVLGRNFLGLDFVRA